MTVQFVYGSHSRLAADLTLDKNLFLQPFSRIFETDEEESWGEGKGERERGCAQRVTRDERETGVEEAC